MANTTLASFASGKLSNVALFNSALISSQVQTLYNNGTPEAAICLLYTSDAADE